MAYNRGIYRPQTITEKDFNNDFIKTCDQITTKYDNFMLLGDMNYDMLVSEKSSALTNMCDIFDLHNLVKKKKKSYMFSKTSSSKFE